MTRWIFIACKLLQVGEYSMLMVAHSLAHTGGFFLHLKEEMLRMEQDTSALDNLAYIWLWQFFKPRNIPADQFRGLRTKVIFHTHHNSDKLTMKQTLHINDKLYTPL